ATRRRPSVPRSSPPTNRPSARAGPPTSTPCAPPGAPPEPAGGHRWPGRSPARSRRDDWPRPPRRPGPPRAGGARRPADAPPRRHRPRPGPPPAPSPAPAPAADGRPVDCPTEGPLAALAAVLDGLPLVDLSRWAVGGTHRRTWNPPADLPDDVREWLSEEILT